MYGGAGAMIGHSRHLLQRAHTRHSAPPYYELFEKFTMPRGKKTNKPGLVKNPGMTRRSSRSDDPEEEMQDLDDALKTSTGMNLFRLVIRRSRVT